MKEFEGVSATSYELVHLTQDSFPKSEQSYFSIYACESQFVNRKHNFVVVVEHSHISFVFVCCNCSVVICDL